MQKTFIILFLFFNRSVFSQSAENKHIFNDTSLYFIYQIDSLNPVHLSHNELTEVEEHLMKAINELYESHQRYADSVNPKKKKNKYQAYRINIDNYFFRLISTINKQGQKEVWISGDCKGWFKRGTGKKSKYDPDWKKNFIEGEIVSDGGACFIYLHINLTLKTHNTLTMNGSA